MYKTQNFRLFSFVTLSIYVLSLLLISDFLATSLVAIETCHKGKYCDMKVTEELVTGGYNSDPALCRDKVTTYPWGNCEDSDDKDESCFTSNRTIEITRRYGLVKESNYTSLKCTLWVTALLAGNAGATGACGLACTAGGVVTMGAACYACIAGWVSVNAGWALGFEGACKKDVCKSLASLEVTKRQVVCAIAYE
ncbi:MAG: hypothetical protein LBG58_14955 [Planctomycetaceae bacterium]|jgi:hypothetical protein|nr:hypothetical protein [Planctomycetaceae bacterium]